MTVALMLSSIADAISNISISGVTVKDKDQIAASFAPNANILYPNPEGWITNFSLAYDTVLQGSSAPMTISYTLNYRFLGEQIGDVATFPAAYSNMVDKVILIINAVIGTPAPYSGKVELKLAGVEFGHMIDPSGNDYHGADLAFAIQEMQN